MDIIWEGLIAWKWPEGFFAVQVIQASLNEMVLLLTILCTQLSLSERDHAVRNFFFSLFHLFDLTQSDA